MWCLGSIWPTIFKACIMYVYVIYVERQFSISIQCFLMYMCQGSRANELAVPIYNYILQGWLGI